MTSSRPSPELSSTPVSSASRPIEDYGLVGDMRGAALVARDGAVDWLCLGRMDATPICFGLLDASQGGGLSVALEGARLGDASRAYRAGTNILETVLAADGGMVVVTDFMPVRAIPDPGVSGPDSEAPGCFVRLITCRSGAVSARASIGPRFAWGLATPTPPERSGDAFAYTDRDLFVAASAPLVAEGGDLVLKAHLRLGDAITLVLGQGAPPDAPIGALASRWLAETEAYWRAWSARCAYRGPHAALVLRSALCLKLLTYAPTGALVAAPTTSLPEVIGGARNWDYRFVWTRDASFTAGAFINLGYHREAAEFLRFLHEADHQGETLRIMYGIDGALPEERALDHLAGWRGSRPVATGNLAYEQAQFEIYGELLAALNLFVDTVGLDALCPSLREDLPGFIARLADTVVDHWREPDHGIWEIRGAPTHQVHSKALCWVALDRAIVLAPRVGLEAPPRWTQARDAIHEDLRAKGWNADKRAFTMDYGGADLDAAVLRLPLLRVIAAADPLMRATSDAIDRELARGDLYYRYRRADGLDGEEGAFAACAYWAVGNRVMRGDLEGARALLERALARANDLGLYPEEYAVPSGAFLGNFPQAFTHMAVIQETLRLSEALGET